MAQVRNGPVVRAPGPFAFSLLFFLSVSSTAAMAWGAQGHRITALFAETLLTPLAREQIELLTGSSNLAELATWAEEYRPGLSLLIAKSEQWHYDNRPVCDSAALSVSYCADGNCASAALRRFEATLMDKNATVEQRGIALRFLIHVLGDIHQPLHVGDNGDAGGNRRNVKVPNMPPRNLHAFWDLIPLERMLSGTDEAGLVAGLREFYAAEIPDWQLGSEAQWMDESYEIARRLAYGALPGFRCGVTPAFVTQLPEAYLDEAQAQESRQLARAGARIAATLNHLLDP